MPLHSSFADFSLVECFRLIEQGHKTGRLTVSCPIGDPAAKIKRYFWFTQGRFVAASKTLNGTDLASEIVRRNWLSQRVLEKLIKLSKQGRPLGLNLKLMGALPSEQLAALFGFQLRQLTPILEVSEGEFQLDCHAPILYSEMTGLSLGAMEVAVGALRRVQRWEALEAILPQKTSAIQRWKTRRLTMKLTGMEMEVLELADGRKSLAQISQLLGYGVNATRYAAFRLMIANLVDEVPPLPDYPKTSDSQMSPITTKASPSADQAVAVPMASVSLNSGSATCTSTQHIANNNSSKKPSSSFLQGIVDFLRSRV